MSIRITNNMMISKYLGNLNGNLNRLDRYGQQLSTGKAINRISQDPIGMINSMTSKQRIMAYEQYASNLNLARNWVSTAETSLMEIHDTLGMIKEQLTQAATGTMTLADKQNVAAIVREYRDYIFENLNSTLGDRYIFGGYNTGTEPFSWNGNIVEYNGIDLSDPAAAAALNAELGEDLFFEIGYSINMSLSFPGVSITGYGTGNMFEVLENIINEMETGGDSAILSGYIADMTQQMDNVMLKLVEVGARSTKLELLENRYAQDIIDYNEIMSYTQDADQAEAIMNYKMSELVYQQALAAGARIIQHTLMDYLR